MITRIFGFFSCAVAGGCDSTDSDRPTTRTPQACTKKERIVILDLEPVALLWMAWCILDFPYGRLRADGSVWALRAAAELIQINSRGPGPGRRDRKSTRLN